MNKSIGSFNLDTHTIIDTAIIHYPGYNAGVEINSVALDNINSKFYANLGTRSTPGFGEVFSFSGDSLATYGTGLNADACAIDFRFPTGVAGTSLGEDNFTVYPNPADEFIFINMNGTFAVKEIKILDLTGRTLDTRSILNGENSVRINIADFPSGIFMISVTTDRGTKVRKFIKK
jgi:hypothetical protein